MPAHTHTQATGSQSHIHTARCLGEGPRPDTGSQISELASRSHPIRSLSRTSSLPQSHPQMGVTVTHSVCSHPTPTTGVTHAHGHPVSCTVTPRQWERRGRILTHSFPQSPESGRPRPGRTAPSPQAPDRSQPPPRRPRGSPPPGPSAPHSQPRPGAAIAPPGRGRGPGAHLAVAG